MGGGGRRGWGRGRHTLSGVSLTLVTGGIRSGKSRHAEGLLREADAVVYVAAGGVGRADDPEWDRRVSEHRARRPAHWTTDESGALPDLLTRPGPPLLVDCLGTWLTALVDRAGLWPDLDAARALVGDEVARLVAALERRARPAVVVTNEVGWTLVADHPAGRFFQDELGRLNATVADRADQVHLVVAGRVLRLPERVAR